MPRRRERTATDAIMEHVDIELETALLAAVLIDPSRGYELAEMPETVFYRRTHQYVWLAMQELLKRHVMPEPISLASELRDKPAPKPDFWSGIIRDIQAADSWFPNWREYARQLQDLAEKRDTILFGAEIVEAVQSGDANRMRGLRDRRKLQTRRIIGFEVVEDEPDGKGES